MSDLFYRDAYEGGYDHGEILRAEIREGIGSHQIAILDYPIPASNFTEFAPELTPMAYRWGTSPLDVRTFYGYVNHHEYVDSAMSDSDRYLRFYCVGTSQPMNNPWPTSWRDVTASYIARLVAERHGLRAIVHRSQTLLPYWTPGQDSDFAMMNRLAEETGYHFWVDGATLFFIDPQVLLTSPDRSLAAEYVMDFEVTDTLVNVQSIHGSLAPVAQAPVVQRVFGIDAGSGTLITASSTQQSRERGIPQPVGAKVYPKAVDSLAEAHRLNDTAATSGAWSRIQAQTVGDAKPRVGSLVSLSGGGLNQIYHGVWLVRDLVHVISTSDNRYLCQIELTRNSTDQVLFTTASTVRDALAEVPAVLRSGVWESEQLETVNV